MVVYSDRGAVIGQSSKNKEIGLLQIAKRY